jgi:hypothetical protein
MEKSALARGETSSQTATYAERYVQGAFWSLTGTLGLRFFNFTANIVAARFRRAGHDTKHYRLFGNFFKSWSENCHLGLSQRNNLKELHKRFSIY